MFGRKHQDKPPGIYLRTYCFFNPFYIQPIIIDKKGECGQQNKIPQSTLGYWIRKIQSEAPGKEPASDLVFTKLPSEQELQLNSRTGNHSVTILLPENIRIEIGADCPARLLAALLQALKDYV